MNRLFIEKRSQIVNALVEENSIRATCRLVVLKLIRDIRAACAAHHNAAVRGVHIRRVQCDEVWAFCYARAKNVPEEKKGIGAVDVWTWTTKYARRRSVSVSKADW